MIILPLIGFISRKPFLYSSLLGGRTIKSFTKNSQRCGPFQDPLILFSFLFKTSHIAGDLSQILLHSLGLHLNIEHVLKVLPVCNRIESLLYLLFVEGNLLLNVLQVVFPVLQVQLLELVLRQQVPIVVLLLRDSCCELPLLLLDEPQPQVCIDYFLPSFSTFTLLPLRIFLSLWCF